MFDRKLINDSRLLSWPGLLVLAMTTWGILSTAPRLVSQRPRGGAEHAQADAFAESVPARLWQDPLSVAHQAHEKAPKGVERRRHFSDLFKSQLDEHLKSHDNQSVLCLTVTMPSNRYAEGAEECRRRRYAVLSALGVAGYAPKNSTGIGYALLPSWHGSSTESMPGNSSTQDQRNRNEADSQASDANDHDHVVVPFEWFEPEAPREAGDDKTETSASQRHSLVFVHYLDESKMEEAPLTALARLVEQMRASFDDFAGSNDADNKKQRQSRIATFAVLGPVSSTTLRAMWQENEHDAELRQNLKDVTCYSTQATATMYRQQATFGSNKPNGSAAKQNGFRVHHLIGKDEELAQELVYELNLRGISAAEDQVALLTEWDTHYGRNMLRTFTAAFGLENRQNVQAITYLRGLDGLLPTESSGTVPEEEDPSGPATDLAVGRPQIDYVRRFVEQMKHRAAKSKDHRIKAIGVLGSDVYDKLILLRALRREFPGAVLFTTDLDDRLLHRREYKWTHNLLIASHYDLRLQDRLQHTVPPFRNSYQTSLYLGCLKAIVEGRGISATESGESDSVLYRVRQIEATRFDSFASNTINDQPHRSSGELNLSDQLAKPCVLVYEVGRSGPYGITRVPVGHWIHPPGSRHYTREQWIRQLKLLLAACFAFLLIIPLSPPIQDFVTATCRGQLDWRHDVVVISILLIAAMWLFIRLDHIRQSGEPFALYEGISVWPTICIRILLIAFCVACVVRSQSRLEGSVKELLGLHAPRGGGDHAPSCQEQPSLGLALPVVILTRLSRRWVDHAVSAWRWAKRQVTQSQGTFIQWIDNGWKHETVSDWGKRIEGLGAQDESLGTEQVWKAYETQGCFVCRHQRLIPHLLVLLAVVLTLFWTFGFAISPARGELCRHFNRVIFIVSSIALTWLIFFVLDAIRLCDRLVWILEKNLTQWSSDAIEAAAKCQPTDAHHNGVCRQLYDRLLDVKTVAAHTDLVSRLIYAPSVGLLIWFVARHSVFDNWGWTPPIIGAFLVAAAITMYAAVFLGRSSRNLKDSAVQAVAGFAATLPADDPVHSQAKDVLREINSTTSVAMEPLRKNPIVSAVLVPFGSLSGLGLLEMLVNTLG